MKELVVLSCILAFFLLLIEGKSSVNLQVANVVHRHDLLIGSEKPHPHTPHRALFAIKDVKSGISLESMLLDISTPGSPSYGHHLSIQEIRRMTANIPAHDAVVNFVLRHGGRIYLQDDGTPNYHYVEVEGSVAMWEKLLHTEFRWYELKHVQHRRGLKLLRASNYILPAELDEYVEGILNIIDFPSEHNLISGMGAEPLLQTFDVKASAVDTGRSLLGTDLAISPDDLNKIYDIRNNRGNSKISQALFARKISDSNGNVSVSDLRKFQRIMNLSPSEITSIGGHLVDGETCSGCSPDSASNVALQYLTGIAQEVPTMFYYYENSNSTFFWMQWLREVSVMKNPPNVISIGYYDYERDVSRIAARLFNIEAMKLGIAGVTLIASSGIDGVAGEKLREGTNQCGYRPLFPSTSPYVTVVGSTMVSLHVIYRHSCVIINIVC